MAVESFPGWAPPEGMVPDVKAKWSAFYRAVWADYQISPQEYRALYLAQLGRCYICRTAKGVHPDDPKGRGSRRLGVDHNHLITGRAAARGLLCTGSLSANTCNRLIARYPHATLLRAARYLEEAPAQVLLQRMDERVLSDDQLTGMLT